MHTPARILAGWDGSANSEHAIAAAVELTKRLDGELIVALVWDLITQPNDWRQSYHQDDALSDVRACAERLVPADVRHKAIQRLGTASDALPTLAREQDVDFVVIGRSGRGGMLDKVFGSTTSNVVRHSHVPVIVVPLATNNGGK